MSFKFVDGMFLRLKMYNYVDLDKVFHICFYGWTRAGKSYVINELLNNYYIKHIPLKNFIIFSPSFSSDEAYKEIWHKMLSTINPDITKIQNVKSAIDTNFLKELVGSQYNKKILNDKIEFENNNNKNQSIFKKNKVKIESYLILIDDCLGDSKMSGFHSELSNFCTRSRHSNIVMIWTA